MAAWIPNNLSHDIAAAILSLPALIQGNAMRPRDMRTETFARIDRAYWSQSFKGNNQNPLTDDRLSHCFNRALQFIGHMGLLTKEPFGNSTRLVQYRRSPSGAFAAMQAPDILTVRFRKAEQEIDRNAKAKKAAVVPPVPQVDAKSVHAIPRHLHEFLRWAFSGVGEIVAKAIADNPLGMGQNASSALRYRITAFLSERADWDFAMDIVKSLDRMLAMVRASSAYELTNPMTAARCLYDVAIEFKFVRIDERYAGPFAA